MPLVICENIELRNIASKSVAVALALTCACGETLVSASAS
jgi:translation initiation factor 1 (eIF-1/SUI1)